MWWKPLYQVSTGMQWYIHQLTCHLLVTDQAHKGIETSSTEIRSRTSSFRHTCLFTTDWAIYSNQCTVSQVIPITSCIWRSLLSAPSHSFWSSVQRYYIQNSQHHVLFTHDSILGAQNLSELNFILEKTILVRRLKDEVGLELPAKMRQTVIVQPSQKDAKAVKQLSEGLDRLQGSKDDNSSKQAKLLEMVSIPLTTGFYD